MEILGLLLIIAIGALKAGRDNSQPNAEEELSVFPDREDWGINVDHKKSWGSGGYYDEQGIYRMPGIHGD
ncbi:hypothetical protein [Endothiovibrio diazotrophicus]